MELMGLEVDFGIADCPVTVGGKLKDLDLKNLIPSKLSRRIDPFVQYGIISANEAIKDSHLNESDINPEKIGVSMGSGIGGLQSIELNHNNLNDRGFKKVSPFFVPGSIVNMTSGLISIEHGFKGPNSSIVTACSSGSHYRLCSKIYCIWRCRYYDCWWIRNGINSIGNFWISCLKGFIEKL